AGEDIEVVAGIVPDLGARGERRFGGGARRGGAVEVGDLHQHRGGDAVEAAIGAVAADLEADTCVHLVAPGGTGHRVVALVVALGGQGGPLARPADQRQHGGRRAEAGGQRAAHPGGGGGGHGKRAVL